jgi:outer membrane usher protein FimD/PapC
MYLALAIIVPAIVSVVIGYSVEKAYGQANMTDMTGANMTETAANMTTSSNMTGTEDVNTTKGSVSGGLAVSDPGAPGEKSKK